MLFQIVLFSLLLMSYTSIMTSAGLLQCRCCQYSGALQSNALGTCRCVPENVGSPFRYDGSTVRPYAQVCRLKYRPYYDPFKPNLCCQLFLV
ncbi:unnamed protein product [Adineta ricciae]|uniref:Secreted protein n=1 Tax=Adineta ricciae TaxID=249248 RepID=A0A815IDH7_ADIRI|nr:unnamed protein product [Adineta ricciae]CAF1367132.1 unnamed protein product [Adineta ricciae]